MKTSQACRVYYCSLSVVMPAYNEQDVILDTIKKSYQFLESSFKDFELILINDGSTDKTAQLVHKAVRNYPCLKLVSYQPNRGYSYAIRTGFTKAKFEFTFNTDSDGQFDIAEINTLFDKITYADMVVGYRLNRQDPFYRVLLGNLFAFTIKVFFGLNTKDPECAFKLYRTDKLKQLILTSDKGGINLELLVKAKQAGLQIAEVGVHHFPREKGVSTISLKYTVNSLKWLISFWWTQRRRKT